VTRSKELRRIERAIEHRDERELRWALEQCAVRKKFAKGHSAFWYRLERTIRATLAAIDAKLE
jgi:hypothetical protein